MKKKIISLCLLPKKYEGKKIRVSSSSLKTIVPSILSFYPLRKDRWVFLPSLV